LLGFAKALVVANSVEAVTTNVTAPVNKLVLIFIENLFMKGCINETMLILN
jgi:hypothetical protein